MLTDVLPQDFFLKLREHLLPRIQDVLLRESGSLPGYGSVAEDASTHSLEANACDFVFTKNDCIYHHKITRFHYTTYDVRRGTDIVNAGTSRCNVMLLADCRANVTNPHHFLYARILGSYHTNVIYTGPGMHDYNARRLDFLWVRWFEVLNPTSSEWSASHSVLDSLRFPPMCGSKAFGFVDPRNVLRSCHILPAFEKGKRNENGVGISRCAKDGNDYNQYYVGRYAQR